uniref:Putative secreted protein n=1 Tax=Lutzomyia longipalpis TaxID=7200 RepID=A0A7G3AMR4_LUTLO
MKNFIGIALCVSLVILLTVPPRILCQDEVELAAARANCEVTYVCCRLGVKKRRFHFLRRLPWRRRARCLRWCPSGNTCIEVPTPFEAYDVADVAEAADPSEFLHGESEDNAQNPDVAEEGQEVTEEEATEQETENPDDEDIVEVPVEGPIPLGISPASVIKVPCNANYRPDRYGVCRQAF